MSSGVQTTGARWGGVYTAENERKREETIAKEKGGIYMAGIVKDDKQRIRELERENERLRRELEEARATTEYVAMMADVELEEEE